MVLVHYVPNLDRSQEDFAVKFLSEVIPFLAISSDLDEPAQTYAETAVQRFVRETTESAAGFDTSKLLLLVKPESQEDERKRQILLELHQRWEQVKCHESYWFCSIFDTIVVRCSRST